MCGLAGVGDEVKEAVTGPPWTCRRGLLQLAFSSGYVHCTSVTGYPPSPAAQVFAVDWSPDGERVASGGRDRVLKM